MAEKITLSKVERYALIRAREQANLAAAEFNNLCKDVFLGHGIKETELGDWQIDSNLSELRRIPKKKEGK